MKEMIPVEAWTTIRYLHAQGTPVRAIAKELGLARNTVRTALRHQQPPRYARPKRPNPQLAPFAGFVNLIRPHLDHLMWPHHEGDLVGASGALVWAPARAAFS